jgi:hypothetical protein
MKNSATKLKKLKTKTIYGFKKGQLEMANNAMDPTTIPTTTTMVMV